jgi:hypothetical protein
LQAVLTNSASVAFDTLHAYLVSEVLEPLAADARALLACIRSVPGVQRDELAHCLGQPTNVIDRLLATVPFVERSADDDVHIHPIVREALALDAETIASYRRAAATLNEHVGRSARAAMLYRIAGDSDSAARVLSHVADVDLGSNFSVELARSWPDPTCRNCSLPMREFLRTCSPGLRRSSIRVSARRNPVNTAF